jgi:hypothetical protein
MSLIKAEKVSYFEKFCKKILEFDSAIRFAGIISDRGKLVAGGFRNGITSFIEERDHEMAFMEVALRIKMRNEFNETLGRVNFTISDREKIIVMSMPLGNFVLYLSAEKNFDLKTPHKILKFSKGNRNMGMFLDIIPKK